MQRLLLLLGNVVMTTKALWSQVLNRKAFCMCSYESWMTHYIHLTRATDVYD